MRVLAAGLNAHYQISPEGGDVRIFALLHEHADEVLLATWSNILVVQDQSIISTGYQKIVVEKAISGCHSAIGDHNGLLAVLDDTNSTYVVEHDSDLSTASTLTSSLSFLNNLDDDRPARYNHLAMAGNGRVVATIPPVLEHHDPQQIFEWSSFEHFQEYHSKASSEESRPIVLCAPGRVEQLVAGTGGFALLTEDGQIYTWGDPRHQSLARNISGEAAKPADQPGLVDALAGIKLKKVCLGGWMGAAVSEDGAAYVWGTGQPGNGTLKILANLKTSGEKVALIQLAVDDGDEPDVVDIALGSGHVALTTSDGEVYDAGENGDGQLGLGIADSFVDGWRKVPDINKAAQVVCGPRCTIILEDR